MRRTRATRWRRGSRTRLDLLRVPNEQRLLERQFDTLLATHGILPETGARMAVSTTVARTCGK